jgi:hypothetical protein
MTYSNIVWVLVLSHRGIPFITVWDREEAATAHLTAHVKKNWSVWDIENLGPWDEVDQAEAVEFFYDGNDDEDYTLEQHPVISMPVEVENACV